MASFNINSGGQGADTASDWREMLKQSVVSPEAIAERFGGDVSGIKRTSRRYPMRINPYYFSLIKKENDPLWIQAVPSEKELDDTENSDDPLFEEKQSPVPAVIHRYPDRVIFLVSNKCAVYCRHCMRKRKVGDTALHFSINEKTIEAGLDYIRKNSSISDVILSGGDPLLLATSEIDRLLEKIYAIPHVDIIRIHTRVLCTLPQRITENLVSVLKKYHPLYINTHFNHPDEVTEEASVSAGKLADAGIALGCQTVLLKGVNDDPAVMKALMKKLLKNRIRPYYLHHPDQVKGTAHLRPRLAKGLEIMKELRGFTSGLCVPQYMIDLPGGGGKVPVLPEYIKQMSDDAVVVQNYEGKEFEYR